MVVVAVGLLTAFARPAAADAAQPLTGPFALAAGACSGGAASGSYFRMVQPSGSVKDGPFVANGDSTCADQTYTLLSPGTDGGFVTGSHQPTPTPAFDASGNSLATRIVAPAPFFGVAFGLATDPKDRQTGKDVPAIVLRADDAGVISGDLRAWAATWNKQNFNQGAPKPDGSTPGLTSAVRGTYDAGTGAFVIEWASTVVGGPFDDFTGVWHLAGTFRAASSTATPTAAAPDSRGASPVAGATATTVVGATQVAGVTQDAVAAPTVSGTSTQTVGAIEASGWLPPAWLIVLTAVLGIVAAASLLFGRRDPDRPKGPRPGPTSAVVVAAVIGVGLALAPVAFQMFTRAPKGGDMITSFGPYMETAKIDSFSGFIADIDAANTEAATVIGQLSPTEAANYPGVSSLNREWPGIEADMTEMLTTMRADIPNYRGVAALPPFVLFPWFFVVPGVLIAGAALWRKPALLVALGVGLLLAPAMFQMFDRAPGGAEMIDDFKPLMSAEKVGKVQGYFLTIGLAEGELRNKLVPTEAAKGNALPASSALSGEWPEESGEMAPMIAAMADNLDNFNAVVALPPFWLFPWFFVLPGILVIGAALFLWRSAQEVGTVPQVIGFPNPVNEVSARLVATGVVLMATLAVVLDAKWILPILAYGFVARVLTGPKLSPLGQLVTKVITPLLPFEEKLVAGPPKRFAQGMGVAFSSTALLLALTDHWFAAQVVLGMLIFAASLEAFLGLCLGCKIFGVLMRFGVVPEEVCESCNNVGKRILDIDAVEPFEVVS